MITPAGSVQYRLAADGSGYENLILAGDWVKTAWTRAAWRRR